MVYVQVLSVCGVTGGVVRMTYRCCLFMVSQVVLCAGRTGVVCLWCHWWRCAQDVQVLSVSAVVVFGRRFDRFLLLLDILATCFCSLPVYIML